MIWVEPFAGSLAVGLSLVGATPFVGWKGSKARYAAAIRTILGVQRADEIWCADVSSWAAVWRALARPGVARAAADIVLEIERDALGRGDCPASYHAVWHELREEWRSRPMAVDARAVAVWVCLVKLSGLNAGPEAAGCKEKPAGAWRRHPRDGSQQARRFDVAVSNPSQRAVSVSTRLRALPDPLPVRVWSDAREIPPRRGAVVLLDPPYVGTSGYQGARGAGQELAALTAGVRDAWLARGCVVACCESTAGSGVVYDLTRGERLGGALSARNHAGRPSQTAELLTVYHPAGAPTLLDWTCGERARMRVLR